MNFLSKKKKKDSGRCPETRQGQAVFAPLRSSQNWRPLDVMRPGPDYRTSFCFAAEGGKQKKYNIRRIMLCQKMEKDAQEIHIHSHRWITMQISATQTILPILQLWIIIPISVTQTTMHLNAKNINFLKKCYFLEIILHIRSRRFGCRTRQCKNWKLTGKICS